jgi:hypothetical protein
VGGRAIGEYITRLDGYIFFFSRRRGWRPRVIMRKIIDMREGADSKMVSVSAQEHTYELGDVGRCRKAGERGRFGESIR